MRVWETKDKEKCHFCGSKIGEDQEWDVESTSEVVAENWKKKVKIPVKLTKVTRFFSKEDQFAVYVCFSCMGILQIDEERANFRYGFPLSALSAKSSPEEAISEKVETPKEEEIERKEEIGGDEKEIEKENPEEKKAEITGVKEEIKEKKAEE